MLEVKKREHPMDDEVKISWGLESVPLLQDGRVLRAKEPSK
jgi:hypothetical protein